MENNETKTVYYATMWLLCLLSIWVLHQNRYFIVTDDFTTNVVSWVLIIISFGIYLLVNIMSDE